MRISLPVIITTADTRTRRQHKHKLRTLPATCTSYQQSFYVRCTPLWNAPRKLSPHLLFPAHALSGCDTVASYFGIGKATVHKTLRSGHSLNLLGAPGHSMISTIQQATSFISACYGQTNCSTVSETRLKVWLSKTGKGSSTPKLCTLPPTTEVFKENGMAVTGSA